MKRKLWFLGSVFSMLLIPLMYFVSQCNRTENCPQYFAISTYTTPNETTVCKTLFGFGDLILDNDGVDLNRQTFKEKSYWWQSILPPTKFWWIIVILASIQWFLLCRKFHTKTKQFAIGDYALEETNKHESVFNPGGFVFNLKYFKIFVFIQIILAVAIFIINILCVVVDRDLKYFLFSDGYQFESLQLNIEYIFPGVLFLTATLISVYCLQKYIKSCQSP